MVYWISEYHRQPVPLPNPDLLKPYKRVWLFRMRSTNERGLQATKDYLQARFPQVQETHTWYLFSRK
jgi:hypothetical protein